METAKHHSQRGSGKQELRTISWANGQEHIHSNRLEKLEKTLICIRSLRLAVFASWRLMVSLLLKGKLDTTEWKRKNYHSATIYVKQRLTLNATI